MKKESLWNRFKESASEKLFGFLRTPEQSTIKELRERRDISYADRNKLAGLLSVFMITTAGCEQLQIDKNGVDWLSQEEADAKKTKKTAEKEMQRRIEEYRNTFLELEQKGKKFEFSGVTVNVIGEMNIRPELHSTYEVADNDDVDMMENMPPKQKEYFLRVSSLLINLSPYKNPARKIALHPGYTDPLEWYTFSKQIDWKNIKLPAYHIDLSLDKEQHATIRVVNWVTGKMVYEHAVPDMDTTVNQNISADDANNKEEQDRLYALANQKRNAVLHEAVVAIQRDKLHLDDAMDALRKQHHQTEEVEPHSVFHLRDGDGIRTLKQLSNEGWRFSIPVLEPNHEAKSTEGDIQRSVSDEDLAEYDEGTYEARGVVSYVQFSHVASKEFHPEQYAKLAAIPAGTTRDKYGNVLITTSETTDTESYINIVAFIPTPLNGAEKQDVFIPISIDLTSVAGPDLKNVLFHMAEHVRFTVGVDKAKYAVYSTSDKMGERGLAPVEDYKKEVTEYANGIALAEKDFGFEPGEIVQKIGIIDVTYQNAHYDLTTKGAVFITDDLLTDRAREHNLLATGYHETGHSITHKLELDKLPELQKLFTNASPKFFTLIAEENWSSGGFGGHPEDNVTEMISSFINTVREADRFALSIKDANALKEYVTFATACKEVLAKKLQVNKKEADQLPPIIGKIDTMVQAVKSELARRNTKG